MRDAHKARPPERARLGKILKRFEMRLAQRDKLVRRIGREILGVELGEIADGGVDDGAALGGAGRGIDRIERSHAQNVLGVDRIGIAQPMFDLGDRKALRSCRARRHRRGLRLRPHPLRPVELARPCEIRMAARHGGLPALAGDRGETLDEARRHRRRAGDLCRMAQHHLARAEELREVVGREADAAFRQIEAERKPHRTAQPGVGIAFRRPGAFDKAAKHDAVARGETRFERPEDAHAQARLQRPAHDAAGEGDGKQFDIVRFRDRQTCCGFARRELVERIRELCAVGAGERGSRCRFQAIARQESFDAARRIR